MKFCNNVAGKRSNSTMILWLHGLQDAYTIFNNDLHTKVMPHAKQMNWFIQIYVYWFDGTTFGERFFPNFIPNEKNWTI